LKGAVRICPLTDYPERFAEMKKLRVDIGDTHSEFELLNVSYMGSGDRILVSLSGIDSREKAKALVGGLISISPEERVSLPDDEYWTDDIIGMEAVDYESGELLGRIEDIIPTGGGDVYAVRTLDGELKLLPAIAEVVRDIDIDKRTMKITLIDGLWD
jgi:16S rRNA processing protein RimM